MAALTPLTQRPLVNTVSLCLILGISRATVYRWMAAGLIEWVRVPSGRRMIYADSLLRDPEERPS